MITVRMLCGQEMKIPLMNVLETETKGEGKSTFASLKFESKTKIQSIA
jgi:hypothetical protein